MSQFRDNFRKKEYDFTRPEYVFNDAYDSQLECDSTTLTSGRHYTVPDGSKYASVTTILSATQSKKKKAILKDWIKRVGVEEAEKIKNDAGDRGNTLHNLCESFIKGEEYTIPKVNTNEYHLFRQVYPELKNINNIHNLEGVLFSNRMQIAGRVDCVAEYKGVLSIIDFKTTIKEKRKEWIEDYFIQTCLYSLMFSEMYGIVPKQTVIIMAKDNGAMADAQVFIESPINYFKQSIQRVREYHKWT